MLNKKKLKLSPKLLITVGLIFVIIPALFYLNQTIQLAFFTPQVTVVEKIAPAPTAISIPSVKIQLPIDQTTIHNGIWEISTKGVSHLSTSGRPTEKGAIILYAHNTIDRFGPIRWLSQGQEIFIKTADGKDYPYTIMKTIEVNPNQLDILSHKTETLILYTCSGFADLKRFVVIATPKQK